jgi:uncharacterized protein (TIGR03435 family)
MLPTLFNHLWQSSLFAAVAGLQTLALRNNHARVRYWVWLAASLKFLIPLSMLVAMGTLIRWQSAPKMTPSGFPTVPSPRPGQIPFRMLSGRARWAAINTTMQDLAGFLSLQVSYPVTDATGLSTKYDFTLSWVSDRRESTAFSANFSGPTLPEAVQEQLGLKLELKKGSVNIFVIDHVEKPSEN